MAVYLLRVTRPGWPPHTRKVGALTAPHAAVWATRDGTARAEILVDGKVTAVYVNGRRTETVN
jgi:hypothetical protein